MYKQLMLSLAVAGMLFTSCADSKEKKTEDEESVAQTQIEVIDSEPSIPDQENLIGTLKSQQDFSTLTTALAAAELEEALSTVGPFTLFAPSNDAFKLLGEETVQALLEESNQEKLHAILGYHVIEGAVDATSLIRAIEAEEGTFEVTTLQGNTLTFNLEEGRVVITDSNGNKSTVVTTDIEAANGVIHTIDAVLIPKE